jgi:hypothetical protein
VSERNLRPANVAAAALVIGGVLLVALPRHALSIVQLVVLTAATATAVYALAVNVPPTGWMSPFKWMSPFGGTVRPVRDELSSRETDAIRSKLSGRRIPVAGAPPMPPEALRVLKPLIRSALDLGPDDSVRTGAQNARLSPLTWSILRCEIDTTLGWLGTVRPNEREVAEVVHHVLDELARLDAGGQTTRATLASHHPHAP